MYARCASLFPWAVPVLMICMSGWVIKQARRGMAKRRASRQASNLSKQRKGRKGDTARCSQPMALKQIQPKPSMSHLLYYDKKPHTYIPTHTHTHTCVGLFPLRNMSFRPQTDGGFFTYDVIRDILPTSLRLGGAQEKQGKRRERIWWSGIWFTVFLSFYLPSSLSQPVLKKRCRRAENS
ncbi:uncharacterized protein GGS25DRAFT_498800 [Hypoxylon fragiforme]|uniref:uncharacterized protein n=1 Tax=Hypoxylon fragiforme TaxID=63214 RepID=UPI0020C5BC57|nr:uncharacterized protein GGS25DRAFT_498800 [Hypoxylon fragiforme]KAI2605958.1 hypothetical protein GGS25DRAFT_498800 [Hypoxylon fragiforme]